MSLSFHCVCVLQHNIPLIMRLGQDGRRSGYHPSATRCHNTKTGKHICASQYHWCIPIHACVDWRANPIGSTRVSSRVWNSWRLTRLQDFSTRNPRWNLCGSMSPLCNAYPTALLWESNDLRVSGQHGHDLSSAKYLPLSHNMDLRKVCIGRYWDNRLLQTRCIW